MNNSPRILALYGDENGCTLWRVWRPYMELQRLGYVAEGCHLDETPQAFNLVALGVFNAVSLCRLSWDPENHGAARRWINSLHRAGVAVIYEVDDDIFTPQIGPRQQATTESNKSLAQLEQERRDRILAMRLCDGVTVSNPHLARVVRQYVDAPVHVVPNSIDLRWWRGALHGVRRVVPPLTIGWAGGARYLQDIEPVAEAWHNIARRYPDVQFVIQGFPAAMLYDAVPQGRCHVFKWRHPEEYLLDMVNIDIGCASVADTQFNRCKTPIKVWEYTMAGAVSVVSPTLYGSVTTDGEDCLQAETAAEWESALARLVEDAQLRRRLWRAQRRRVASEHSLAKNVHQWLDAWQSIIDHYQAGRPRLALAG